MKRSFLPFFSVSMAALWLLAPAPASADASHARIIRLSLVQGDVRFTREFHKDSLGDSKALWERAPLNLPIREGYALATDNNSRAEVEFENGAMAFLSPNTVVEFYDLSLDDGAKITRLILRQGSGIFYVHPAQNDYFSVTGGDFSVEANGRTRFRLDNYDDGSNVNVEQGQINVLRNKTTKALEKGQSYSVNVNNASAPATVARAGEDDDFDKWVSGRIDAVATATTYSSQYVNSPDYSSGFADLYNYGNFYNVPGYGYGWQPSGVGAGWSPFSYGSWYSDPSLGWNFISSAPWGWLPFHYGGWMFGPMGWMWMPTGFGFGGMGYGYGGLGFSPLGYGYGGAYGGPVYRPITAVWVHSGGDTGLVPVSPQDAHSKTPANLAHGVYALKGNAVEATPTPFQPGEKYSVMKSPPRGALTATTFAASTQPVRVSRTILSGRAVTLSRDSSIVYDPAHHAFVNNNNSQVQEGKTAERSTEKAPTVAAENRGAKVPTAERPNSLPARPRISPPEPRMSAARSGNGPHGEWGDPRGGAPVGVMPSSSSSSSTASAPSAGHSGGGGHH
jgi:FecR protein